MGSVSVLSGLFFQDGHLHCGSMPESQFLVKRDRCGIGGPCVEEWLLAALLDGMRDDRRESPAETTPLEVRMGTYAADFRETRKPHALPRHCYQTPIDADANEAAHCMSARQKGAWLGQFRQSEHFLRVRITKYKDCIFACLGLNGPGRQQLNALGFAHGHKTVGHADCGNLEQKNGVVIADESGKGRKTRGAIVGRGGENIDVAPETLGKITTLGEVRCIRQ